MVNKTLILIAFIIISILNVIFNYGENKKGIYLTKPLIMPLLILHYVASTSKVNIILIGALLCGFLGDVFLLDSKKYFINGLLSFFCGHVLYIVVLLLNFSAKNVNDYYFVFMIPYIIYAYFLVRTLLPYLGGLKVLGTMYMSTILAMSFISLLIMFQKFNLKTVLILIGTIIFVISDSLLAFDTFKKKLKHSGVFIMSTYIIAQYLIIMGLK